LQEIVQSGDALVDLQEVLDGTWEGEVNEGDEGVSTAGRVGLDGEEGGDEIGRVGDEALVGEVDLVDGEDGVFPNV
jgi:hypothetical protein